MYLPTYQNREWVHCYRLLWTNHCVHCSVHREHKAKCTVYNQISNCGSVSALELARQMLVRTNCWVFCGVSGTRSVERIVWRAARSLTRVERPLCGRRVRTRPLYSKLWHSKNLIPGLFSEIVTPWLDMTYCVDQTSAFDWIAKWIRKSSSASMMMIPWMGRRVSAF